MNQKEYWVLGLALFVIAASAVYYQGQSEGMYLSPPVDSTSCWESSVSQVYSNNCLENAAQVLRECNSCCLKAGSTEAIDGCEESCFSNQKELRTSC